MAITTLSSREFNQDAGKAKTKYNGTLVKITGKITDIKADDKANLSGNLKGDGADKLPVKFFPFIEEPNLKKVKDGDEVSVFGTVGGVDKTPDLENAWFP